VPRVIVYECCPGPEDHLHRLLEDQSYEVVSCHGGEALLEAAVERRADALVFELKPECKADLGLLHLLRRVAPAVPLILVASDGSLETQRLVQELRPMYYAVIPVEPAELREAVRSAIERSTRRSAPQKS
jgi:DNA-binding NtrC family response regulator